MTTDPSTASADELLAALAVRDLDAQDPRVVSRFATDSALADRWVEIAATIDHLVDTGAAAAIDLAPTATTPPIDTMAAIRAFRAESHDAAPAAPRSRRWPIVGAALVAAALALCWMLFGADRPSPDPRLGGSDFVLTPRDRPWSAEEPLRWHAVRGADGYRIEIRSREATSGAAPTTIIPERGDPALTAPEWQPTPAVRAALPARFAWRVTAYSADGQITSPWAETWR